MRQRRRHRRNRHLDLAGDEGGKNARVAFVRNRLDVDSRCGLEHLHGQVQRVAGARHAVIECAGLGFCQRDQLRHRARRQFWATHQHELRSDELRHRDEVAHHVERQRAIDGGADRLPIRVLQDGVPVGRRLRDRVGRDIPARARTVLHDDRLAPRFGKLCAEHARERVDGAAGDEGNDDADRLARIVLGDGIARVKRERRERYHEAEAPHDAVCPTVRVLVLFTRLAVHHNRPSRSPASARAAYSAAARAGLSCAAMR